MEKLKVKKMKDVVLDTDPFNEVDDQFAIAYLLASDKQLNVKAIYAAPFFNVSVSSPEEGMERSYKEILHILKLTQKENLCSVYKGSIRYLPDDNTPIDSEAARHLVELSKKYNKENRLYVVAIAAITNIASAILIDPTIVDRISIVWLGCNEIGFWSSWEFNLQQDVAAARVVFKCSAPLTLLPCGGVVSHFLTTAPELHYWLDNQNPICDYLVDTVEKYMHSVVDTPWSRVIWDVVAIACVLDDEGEEFIRKKIVKAPYYENNLTVKYPKSGKDIGYVYEIKRDEIYLDMIKKLRSYRGEYEI